MLQTLKNTVNEQVKKGKHPGICFSLMMGSHKETKTSGVKASGRKELLTENSVFEIGSLSKIFVSLLYSDLFIKIKLDPESKIDSFLPYLRKTWAGSIKLEELLTHSSGLPRLPGGLNPSDPYDPYKDFTIKMLEEELISSRDETGKTYCYSNLGFAVLGIVLEKVLGSSLEKSLENSIFSKLGMNETFLSNSHQNMEQIVSGHRRDLTFQKPWELGVFQAAGGVKSTIGDLTKFLSFCLCPGNHELANAFRLSSRKHYLEGKLAMGYGWHFDENILVHEGGTYGHRSFIAVSPDSNSGIVVLANSCNELGDLISFIKS